MKVSLFGVVSGVLIIGNIVQVSAQTCFQALNLNTEPKRTFQFAISTGKLLTPGTYPLTGIEVLNIPSSGCAGSVVNPVAGAAYVTPTQVTLGFTAYSVTSTCDTPALEARLSPTTLSGPIYLRNNVGQSGGSTLTHIRCPALME